MVSGVGDSGWTLLSNHGKVLLCIARDPEMRVTDIAAHAGIKERAVQRILAELRAAGYISSTREGSVAGVLLATEIAWLVLDAATPPRKTVSVIV